jgi:hypothetical protein
MIVLIACAVALFLVIGVLLLGVFFTRLIVEAIGRLIAIFETIHAWRLLSQA